MGYLLAVYSPHFWKSTLFLTTNGNRTKEKAETFYINQNIWRIYRQMPAE